MCGCIYEHPDPDCVSPGTGGSLRVTFDWRSDPTARPEGMSVLFYPDGGGDYWQYEFALSGGSAHLPPGDYRVVCFNNDTGSILFENQEDYDKALITTRAARLTDGLGTDYAYSQPPRSREEEDQPVVSPPDVIWGCPGGEFTRRPDGEDLLTLAPVPLVARYTVRVVGTVNPGSVAQGAMAISGLAAGRLLSTTRKIPVEVTVPGALHTTPKGEMDGWLLGFGRVADRGRCLLSLYLVLRDGSRKVYEYDVTSIVESAPDPLDVEIIVTGPELPEIETGGSGSGLDVGVDDWDVVDIELST